MKNEFKKLQLLQNSSNNLSIQLHDISTRQFENYLASYRENETVNFGFSRFGKTYKVWKNTDHTIDHNKKWNRHELKKEFRNFLEAFNYLKKITSYVVI
tara:strand:+ start:82 stop:378 length:297 start_codon:yes stop_codon:yes gene_type:complete